MIPHAKIRSALRKIWLYSPERRDAKRRARMMRGFYQCSTCKQMTREPEIDHVTPVGRTPGAKGAIAETWDGLMQRLFCPPEGLRVLCKACHLERKDEHAKLGA